MSTPVKPTCSELELYPVVRALLARARTRRTAIRLLGVELSNLRASARQLSLFGDRTPLHRAVDRIRRQYGYASLGMALAGHPFSDDE